MNRIAEHMSGDETGREEIKDLVFRKFVLDSIPVAVVTVNAGLEITGFNPMAEEITGFLAKEAIGRYCGDILRGGLCAGHCPLQRVLRSENPLVRTETAIQNKWGETIPVRIHVAGLMTGAGQLIGGVEAFVDNSRLKALEREKANLVSMIAHDMKSPLVSIQGFTRRLLSNGENIEEETRKAYLEIVGKEAAKIESLINDFLEFSRLQTGKLQLSLGATSLDRVLLELLDVYQPKASRCGVELELRKQTILPIIEADANRLQRVFTNLLDNALKFSRNKDKVTIETQHTDEHVIVKVIDQGAGIDPNDLPYIFDPYHRGEGAKQSEGYGVGLAAVKAIVEGHGGKVLVESALGKGSVFTVVLPKNGPHERSE